MSRRAAGLSWGRGRRIVPLVAESANHRRNVISMGNTLIYFKAPGAALNGQRPGAPSWALVHA